MWYNLNMEGIISSEKQGENSVLLPVEFPNGKWGFINDKGEIVINSRFDKAWGFAGGLAIVEHKGKRGAINQRGEYVIEPRFFELAGPSEGLFVFARRKNKYGYMDTKGNIVIKPVFNSAYSFYEGRALVRLNEWERAYTFINPEGFLGNYNIPLFVEYRKFPWKKIIERKELPSIDKQMKYGFIDKYGNLVVKGEFKPPIYLPYHSFIRFSEGFAALVIKRGFMRREVLHMKRKAYYVNRDGEFTFGPFDDAYSFSEGYACVKLGDYYGFINTKGKFVFEPFFESNPAKLRFSNGLLRAPFDVWRRFILSGMPPDKDKNPSRYKWGYLNKNFQVAIPPAFDEAEPFTDGLAAVEVGGKWGYIDTMGRWVIRPRFEEAFDFIDGIAEAIIKGTSVYLNRQGEIIWPPEDELVVN